jgi:hypothetical protein
MFFQKKSLFCFYAMLVYSPIVLGSDQQIAFSQKIKKDGNPPLKLPSINFSFLKLPHTDSNDNQGHATHFKSHEYLKKLVLEIKSLKPENVIESDDTSI